MRSGSSGAKLLLLAVIAVAAMSVSTAQDGGMESSAGSGRVPTKAEVESALAQVKADPNLATERKVRTLKWARDRDSAPPSGGPTWLMSLFQWIGHSARYLVWVATIIVAALLGIYIVRLIRERTGSPLGASGAPPSHVRDLDIRPESLPPDIAASVRALWGRGAHRAALALLYRGLLSRLAHVHRVPIRDSSTEGDCVALAVTHLDAERSAYVQRLVRVWQRAVYGGEHVETDVVHELCDGFSAALDLPAASERDASDDPAAGQPA